MKIWANTLVRNEERYLWFSVMSVIDYVDKILIWDTGSDDSTVEIIKEIIKAKPGKVEFNQFGKVDAGGFTKARQEMLKKTNSDWLVLLDGDEIWWDDAIFDVTKLIRKRGREIETIVSRYYNLVGDIYHYQEEKAGMYEINGVVGHITVRAMNRKIPGLHFDRPHGQLGIFDADNELIQKRSIKKRIHHDARYLHFTNMTRSFDTKGDRIVPKRAFKYKYELGKAFLKDFYYPEVFFRNRSKIVLSPWENRSFRYFIRALPQTPLKLLKRRIYKTRKSGY